MMAAGEDGAREDHVSETSAETASTTEVEASSGPTNTGSNSGSFASTVLPGVREASRKLQLKMNFRTLSSPKRTDKNEPSRFVGEGVSFKAKLIGILEVAEARGDRMCQDALADLKMAIRAAGEHKQRITINIALDGLRLRDEKTGDCLYHHLVHKISFIAQDMTDPRAFGYIFGSPDTGHRFFGIKTDKAASQVVECIRDLFQVVFALKNREQHIEQHHLKLCSGSTSSLMSSNNVTAPSVTYMEAMAHHLKETRVIRENGSPGASGASTSKPDQVSEATIADLLDLEYELNSIHQNIHQAEHSASSDQYGSINSKDDVFGNDPFGDSFTSTTTKTTKTTTVAPLPPPPSAKDSSRLDGTNTHRRERTVNRAGSTTSTTTATVSAPITSSTASFGGTAPLSAPLAQEEKHWFDQETEALFDETELTQTVPNSNSSRQDQDSNRVSPLELSRQATLADQFDVFTELDPLGTGRSKPYIDKKDFFSDLKNPPKKVLKDLVGEVDPLSTSAQPLFPASFDSGSRDLGGSQTGTALGDVLSALDSAPGNSNSFPAFSDPFSDDPFDKTDPFAEGSFSETVSFSPNTVMQDPFETGFADFSSFPPGSRNSTSPLHSSTSTTGSGTMHGPLRVSLPPEEGATISSSASCLSPSPPLSGSVTKQRNRFARKQLSVSLVKIPSPKSSQRRSRLPKQMTVDGSQTVRFPPLGSSPTPPLDDLSSVHQRRSPGGLSRGVITPSPPIIASFPDLDGDAGSRLSGSSAELADIAPEPPPRPAPNAFSIKPPPLPPKKHHTGTIYKPPPRPPHQDDNSIYDHIENYESSTSPTPHDLSDLKTPPIPVPARKPRYSDENSAPMRPKKQAIPMETDDGYLAPIPFLPPPVKRNHSSTTSLSNQKKGAETIPGPNKKSLDITLSQLTKTGFADLASTLGMSPSQLSKMTLQDLTKCLSSLSDPSTQQADVFSGSRGSLSKAEYTALRESVDEDSGFAAEFDDNFCNANHSAAGGSSTLNQESLYDKYAVFRELLLQDGNSSSHSTNESESKTLSDLKDDGKDSQQEEPLVETILQSTLPHSSPITISVVAQSDSPATSNIASSTSPSSGQALVDRYAALREISICDESSNKDDDEKDDDRDALDNNGYAEVENDLSDKDDSITEVIHEAMHGAVQDEDQDLLTLSAQHSESTESPTLESNTVRDAPSIMETTILEEDTCISEGDIEQTAYVQCKPSLLDSSSVSLKPVPENQEVPTSRSLTQSLVNGSNNSTVVPGPATAAQPIELSRPQSLESKPPAESWAKFDSSQFEKPVSDEGASPWSSDGKEFSKSSVSGWKDDSDHERREAKGRRRRPNRGPGASAAGSAWVEDEESEEGWDDRVSDDPWENGFEEGPPGPGRSRYPEPRRSRRRKLSPWRRGGSREVSPWESGDSTGPSGPQDERWHPGHGGHGHDDDMKRAWKTRPKNRGSSWEEERTQRLGGGPGGPSGGSEYEDAPRDTRKRRQSPWGDDRDRERERWHGWEEDEWYQRRERSEREGWDWYYRDRDRDRERRWEYERGRDWDRYGRPRHGPPHYRDSPWDDELSEQGEDESPHAPHSHPHSHRKWRRSRPSSAASRGHERVSPSTSTEYKEEDSPASTGPPGPGGPAGPYSRRRPYWDHDRASMGGSMERRSRSREDTLSSDQEHEFWAAERGERTRSRTERDPRYEQRAQTLHARRSNRTRYKTYDQPPTTPAVSFSQKSPFEDDFSSQRFDYDGKSFNQESSLDASETNRSPLATGQSLGLKSHLVRKKDSLSETDEARVGDGMSLSPLERGRGRVSSISSSRRQSPFEDDFTPPESRKNSARHMSSASSDVSEQNRFVHDEAGSRPGSRPGSGRVRQSADSENRNSGRSIDDVFLPAETNLPDASPVSHSDNVGEPVISPNRPSSDLRRSVRISGDDKNLAGMKARLSNLRRTDSSSSLRKSESINIFARSCDPFDDDDFFNEDGSTTQAAHGKSEHNSDNRSGGDQFKWTEAFESFNFEEEQ